MKILGKVVKVCPKVEGQSDNGNFWEKQDLVIAVGDKETKVAISFFGERRTAMLKPLQPGDLVEVHCSVESRESNEKWYTSINGYGLSHYQKEGNAKAEQKEQTPQVQMPIDDEVGF